MTTKISNTVSVQEMVPLLKACIEADQPVLMLGDPGVGKTSVAKQVAKELGIGLRVILFSIKQPVDLAGLPVPDLKAGVTRWLRPEDLPTVERDGERGILLLDEMNTASPSMQAAGFQLVLERRVGEHKLPDGWIPVATGNLLTNRAAAQRMPTALQNRFATFHVVPTVSGWTQWAQTHGVDPYMTAFINFRPKLLHVMPETPEQTSFPTPRSNAAAAKFVNQPAALRVRLMTALIGEAASAEFEGFLQMFTELPTLQEILDDPDGARVPDRTKPGCKFAAAGLISRAATRENFATLMIYAARLGREYEFLGVVGAVKRAEAEAKEKGKPELRLDDTEAYTRWAVKNQDIVV